MKNSVKLSITRSLLWCEKAISSIVYKFAITGKGTKNISSKCLFIDCSHICVNPLNTGIQRVLMNIVRNSAEFADQYGYAIQPVILQSGKVKAVDPEHELEIAAKSVKSAGLIPHKVKYRIQALSKAFYQDVSYKEGDILLLLDASWSMDIFRSVHKMKRDGVTVICAVYDLIPIDYPDYFKVYLNLIFTRWVHNTMETCDGYIAISDTVKNDIIHYISLHNVDTQRYLFDYFQMGSNFKAGSADTAKINPELSSIFNGGNVYLTVSTIEPRKNHAFILHELEKLWENGADFKWLIVGRIGWAADELIERVKKHKEFGRKLFMLNNVNDNSLAYCYEKSKALIFASITEGYGLPIIESLKSGLPVMASDTPIHREVGQDMVDYFSISAEGGLRQMVSDVESGKRELKKPDADAIHITSWKEAAEDLINKLMIMNERKRNKNNL